MTAIEANFDSLVGPTHNYAGLAQGNLASQKNRALVSHPRQAAREGLDKMKFLADLGIPQFVLPPQLRPHIPTLRRLGFTGSDSAILATAAKTAPRLLAAVSSASAMWAANAATISPSPDTADHKLHITPANLASHFHRSIETPQTAAILRTLFPGPLFHHHDPLPSTPDFFDEGAANHNRLSPPNDPGSPGIELFIFGRDPTKKSLPTRFTPRHSHLASLAIARSHQLDPNFTFFAQQHPAAINAGVFHNDVIALTHENILLHHQFAFRNSPTLLKNLRTAFQKRTHADLHIITIPEKILPLKRAVASYLFNSQLVTLPTGQLALIAPAECQSPRLLPAIAYIRDRLPRLTAIHFLNVRQSMRNGGGPACLRIRAILTRSQLTAIPSSFRLTPPLHSQLKTWINRFYRESLDPAALADPNLLAESTAAFQKLATILGAFHVNKNVSATF